MDESGVKRYDFQFINKRGHKTTIEGLSDKFNPEFWNYAKLISGVAALRNAIDQVLKLVGGLELDSQSQLFNTCKMGRGSVPSKNTCQTERPPKASAAPIADRKHSYIRRAA